MHLPSLLPPRSRARLASLSLLALAVPLHAQRPAAVGERGSFVVVAGKDTVAVERFTRIATGVDADLLIVRGGLRVRHVIGYAPNGRTIATYAAEFFPSGTAAGAPPAQRAALQFVGDTMIVDAPGQSAGQRSTIRTGALPWMNPSVLLLEEITRRARATGGASMQVPMINLTGGGALAVSVERVGRDSLSLAFPDVVFRLAVDRHGRILGGRVPSQGVLITRTGSMSASRGAAGAAAQRPSPKRGPRSGT